MITTHWIPRDGPLYAQWYPAACGALVHRRFLSEMPTCAECQRVKAEHDRDLEEFAAEEGIRFVDDPRRI